MILKILLLANICGLYFSPTHLYGKYHQEGHPPEVTEPGEDCRKFTRFHESLRKAGSSFDQTCVDTSPICKYYLLLFKERHLILDFVSDECMIPTAEVLKKCVRGVHVNALCVDQMYQVCEMILLCLRLMNLLTFWVKSTASKGQIYWLVPF